MATAVSLRRPWARTQARVWVGGFIPQEPAAFTLAVCRALPRSAIANDQCRPLGSASLFWQLAVGIKFNFISPFEPFCRLAAEWAV